MIFNDEDRDPTYDDLRSYILKNYGYSLNDEELDLVINWFTCNRSSITISNLQTKITEFLYRTFPGRTLYLTHDDSSNLNYLYNMLKSNIKKK